MTFVRLRKFFLSAISFRNGFKIPKMVIRIHLLRFRFLASSSTITSGTIVLSGCVSSKVSSKIGAFSSAGGGTSSSYSGNFSSSDKLQPSNPRNWCVTIRKEKTSNIKFLPLQISQNSILFVPIQFFSSLFFPEDFVILLLLLHKFFVLLYWCSFLVDTVDRLYVKDNLHILFG